MPHMREVKTCDRCRHFKRRCDLLKPACSRCVQAGVRCSFETTGPSTDSSSGAPGSDNAKASLSPTPKAEDGSQNGLISPSASAEDADQLRAASMPGTTDGSALADGATPGESSSAGAGAGTAATAAGQRVVRKRKRNCLSCLRCHRLKVKCDKELPCGRCKSSGNGRECYYSYNKGPNGGKFPCPTVPTSSQPSASDITKSTQATWHVSHEPRGSSHWKDLMTKVRLFVPGSDGYMLTCSRLAL